MTWDSEAVDAEYEVDTEHWAPSGALADATLNWQQFLDEYWGLSAASPPGEARYSSWEEVRRCKPLAESLLRALTQTPIAEPSTSLDQQQMAGLRRDLQCLGKIWLLNQLLELGMPETVLKRASGAAERATRLPAQVQIGDLPVKAQSYLRRGCELYLDGFDTEVAVMARAAIEAAARSHRRAARVTKKWICDPNCLRIAAHAAWLRRAIIHGRVAHHRLARPPALPCACRSRQAPGVPERPTGGEGERVQTTDVRNHGTANVFHSADH